MLLHCGICIVSIWVKVECFATCADRIMTVRECVKMECLYCNVSVCLYMLGYEKKMNYLSWIIFGVIIFNVYFWPESIPFCFLF